MYLRDMKKELLTKFNTDNKISPPVEVTDVIFENAGVWLQGECNAKVTIRAIPANNAWMGTKALYYNRVPVDAALRSVVLPRSLGPYTTSAKVCQVLQELYGVSTYPADFFSENYPAGITEVKLNPNIDSLVWQPPYSVTIPIVD